MCSATPSTPPAFPTVPAGLPSVWDLAALARACAHEAHRIDVTPEEFWDAGPTAVPGLRKAEALGHAWAREQAIMDLAETLPAVTLKDALVLILIADRHIDALSGMVSPACGNGVAKDADAPGLIDRLQRIIDNAAPVLAAAIGVTLSDIEAEHIENRRAWTFGPVADAASQGPKP